MTVEELLVYGKSNVHKDHAKLLLASILNKNPLELLLYLDEEVSDKQEDLYKKEIDALKNNEPLQYVIGNVNFYGYNFKINKNVLIPRFETEELVEKTLNYINTKFTPDKHLNILDIGCGSGAIGITLKKKIPSATVTLLDISKDALEVAKENAQLLNADVKFIESDVFNNVQEKYDIIISNPPYIMENEKIEDIVKDNEPYIALYAGKDGLDCYKKIMKDIKFHLNEDFLVAFEIGQFQGPSLINMANYFLENINVTVEKDLQGRDRMVFISSKSKKDV